MQIKAAIPRSVRPILRPIAFWLYRIGVRSRCWYLDKTNHSFDGEGRPVPPAMMRFRVGETTAAEVYLAVGRNIVNDIEIALGSIGRRLEDFKSILDFGCGCGRTIMWLQERSVSAAISGTDVDEASIRWCAAHLPFATFSVNAPDPPLAYQDCSFDLIYGISVLTHLEEARQFRWLTELHRVLKPNGLLLLSVHGADSWHGLPKLIFRNYKPIAFSSKPPQSFAASSRTGIIPLITAETM